jgi:nicotinamidase-related amidase
VIHTALIVYDM